MDFETNSNKTDAGWQGWPTGRQRGTWSVERDSGICEKDDWRFLTGAMCHHHPQSMGPHLPVPDGQYWGLILTWPPGLSVRGPCTQGLTFNKFNQQETRPESCCGGGEGTEAALGTRASVRPGIYVDHTHTEAKGAPPAGPPQCEQKRPVEERSLGTLRAEGGRKQPQEADSPWAEGLADEAR